MADMSELAIRFRKAWADLSPAAKARVEPLVRASHDQVLEFLHERTARPNPNAARELVFAQSVLDLNQDSILSRVSEIVKAVVDRNGEIWGPGKFQRLDKGWLEAGVIWLEYLVSGKKHDFPSNSPPVIRAEEPLNVALAGDWGTGDWGTGSNLAASTRVRKSIANLHPDLTIHLGDVYYAGTETNEEKFLVDLWPGGSTGSFALNSNHEMYPGAFPYFREALGGSRFAAQKQHSFFAIETEKWIIVGLDSAYESSIWNLYREGVIESSAQIGFLRAQVAKDKKIIVLTHHNPLSLDGVQQNKLWQQVTDCFPRGSNPAHWYWGHLHAGIVYKPQAPTGIRCRCVGHGALPWGFASSLETSPRVEWFEKRPAGDAGDPDRVLNGFVLLNIEGSTLTETFYDENGRESWPSLQS